MQETYVVMEWCEGGSLDSAVAQQVFCMPTSGAWGQQADALKISATLLDIASGMGYLHQMHIVHRDLKLKNVLLRRSQVCLEVKSNSSLCLRSMIQQNCACLCLPGQVNHASHNNHMLQTDWRGFTAKVADFGLSQLIPETSAQAEISSGDCFGTVTYMAPEVLEGGRHTTAADVYAFGIMSKLACRFLKAVCECCLCISVEGCPGVHAMQVLSAVTRMSGLVMLPAVYELWTGHSAFSGMSKLQIMAGVVSSGLRPKLPRDCPAWYSSLAAACWATSPTRRYVHCSFPCTASQFWLPGLHCCSCSYVPATNA